MNLKMVLKGSIAFLNEGGLTWVAMPLFLAATLLTYIDLIFLACISFIMGALTPFILSFFVVRISRSVNDE